MPTAPPPPATTLADIINALAGRAAGVRDPPAAAATYTAVVDKADDYNITGYVDGNGIYHAGRPKPGETQ